MQYKNLLLLGLAGFAIAQNDSDCDSPDSNNDDGGNNCSTANGQAVATSTLNGIVVTTRDTTTDVGRSTTLVPVVTQSVATTTDVGVDTERNTLTETTDIGTTPTNTMVQYATTTDVNLQSGYAYTTDDSGHTIATYTGTGRAPSMTGAAGAAAASRTTTSSDSGVMATAVPYFGAAAMAGLAFAL